MIYTHLFLTALLLCLPIEKSQATGRLSKYLIKGVNVFSHPFGVGLAEDFISDDLGTEDISTEGLTGQLPLAGGLFEDQLLENQFPINQQYPVEQEEEIVEQESEKLPITSQNVVLNKYLPYVKNFIADHGFQNRNFKTVLPFHLLSYYPVFKKILYKPKAKYVVGKEAAPSQGKFFTDPALLGAGAVGFKFGALAPIAIPAGIGAAVGAPVGAIVGAKVGAIKGALIGKALLAKKVAIGAAAGRLASKYASAPIFAAKEVASEHPTSFVSKSIVQEPVAFEHEQKFIAAEPQTFAAEPQTMSVEPQVIAAEPSVIKEKVFSKGTVSQPKSIEATFRVKHPLIGNQFGRVHLEPKV